MLDQVAFLDLDQQPIAQDARIIDQDVDPAESLTRRVHHALDLLGIGEIAAGLADAAGRVEIVPLDVGDDRLDREGLANIIELNLEP